MRMLKEDLSDGRGPGQKIRKDVFLLSSTATAYSTEKKEEFSSTVVSRGSPQERL